LRRLARAALIVGALLVAIVVLVVGGGLAFLSSPWGGALARRLLVPRVNARIAGHLEVGRIALRPSSIRVENVELDDPEGALVARVVALEVDFSPLALLRRDVSISRLLVERPMLRARQDRGGWNVSRALGARSARPGPSSGESPRGRLEIALLRIESGVVDVKAEESRAAVELSADGAGRFDAATGDLDARLRVAGDVGAPLGAPLALGVDLHRRAGDARGDVDLVLGRAQVQASGALDRRGTFRVEVARAHLTPEVVRALAPEVRARAALDARASLAGAGTRGRAQVDLACAGGRLHIEADGDAAARRLRALTVTGTHVDLGGALEGLPPSDLSFELEGHGGGTGIDDLVGALRLTARRGTLGGYDVGPLRLDASSARGVLHVAELGAALPGLQVEAWGAASRRRLDLGVDLRAHDLAATSRSLEPLVSAHASGTGRLRVHVGGTLAAPSVSLEGNFPSLSVAGLSASALEVAARWSDVRRPLVANASLHMASARLRGHDVSDVKADLTSQGRDFRLDLSMAGRDALGVSAAGRWHTDRRGLSLSALAVTTPELRWTQAQSPLELTFEPRRLGVDGLDLRAGDQRIRADLALEGGRLRATAEISRLDLHRLPRLLMPMKPPAARLDARARLDLPTRWPPSASGAPVTADVELDASDVDASLPVGGAQRRIQGGLAVKVDLAGTTAAPRLAGRARLAGASLEGARVGDLSVELRGDDGGPSSVSVALVPAVAGSSAVSLSVSTPLSLAGVLSRPPRDGGWLRTPFEVTGDARDVPLAAFAPLVGRGPLRGTLAARISMRGTAVAPTGALSVEAHGASGPSFPPTDVRADVAFGERDVRLAARVWRAAEGSSRRLIAWASGVAKIPSGRLAERDALERAPLDVRFGVGPLVARQRGMAGDLDVAAGVHLEGTIGGTARQPTAAIRIAADPVSIGGTKVGTARATLDYAERVTRLDATLASANGGTMRLTASVSADLGVSALTQAPDPRRWPLEAHLDAQDVDLSWLPALTPQIRKAAGTLTASVRVQGTVGAPRPDGRVEWKQGSLLLAGLGDYEKVHLVARADGSSVTLDELTADSSGGHARLSGAFPLAATGAPVRLSAKLDRFPVYGRGQILARVTVDTSVEGAFEASKLDLHARIPEARVEIAEIQRRNVQSLERPGDIVLVENGHPIEGKATARKSERPQRPFVTLVVDAPRNIWVRGDDANIELGFSPGFRVELGAEPQIYGRVIVLHGRVDVLGRRFDLQKDSQVELTGPPDKPVLDVTAKHVSDSANVTVVVTIKGPIDALSINVSAPERPDLTQTQLYTLIITGRLDLGGAAGTPTSTSSEAASLVGGVLAGALQKAIAPRLPLDVFTFETGDGLTGSRLEAGKNVGSKLYIGYVGRTGVNPALLQNRNAVRLQYQFTSRWSLDAEYGDVGTGTADLFWTKRY
jgi:translocation and assembly module TamB